jgi:phage-related protein
MVDAKPLVWLGGEIKTPPLSSEARIEAGTLLRKLQNGERLFLPHSRPMPQIAKECHEIRVNDQNQTWRIVYAIESDAIVILEVFSKKTATTPQAVIATCQRRIKQYRSA